ncbi:MAG: glutaminyl-tRNA synthase (glutamine-hydrolyzing) subunit A [Candidatus Staskawiczbacteria bacterium RIFOXYB2_FULL_32_9]|uniref:Glutamyl-tRNA(Gln) amidotransferase subunit A n=1 Tax=Candidatus Staskawiczbacteria bacterium RIFOXYD1_FULL_32_13 TaxID=1802234 RepID=A0A1G2JQW7_9BACT|nr:MAG: glutaminyl-tRNA synthase (glutamine-hydrolyzing) subunit A [Candidatus Staskawiczbacteria bacterium RIFOXYB1_FULL_32_11]OGZ79459.1 MAG: glutaminyl-tRNA synthase (glutamine-hydrolyzing) subunit A [Candidatus Staskawiczbacteria bacterium RIFOXYA2_FULL_32_7]OGZ84089.1 MAG: glutaminyl-tRNA synthase (glutamine-hydrolyzing) subunit A [Candidatus Staskawiczbacteria bacterium RIFOXYB2_FULL_32_9]OGZ87360.1 MAG: glutaminyl-tRNA synthase (glutamine-hydrolyzing) subunit A [Candidatus Staskawiczbacte
MKLENFTIKQINKGLKEKEFSAKELALAYFDKIKKTDNEIGAYLSLSETLAISQAEEADKEIALRLSSGQEFPILAGVPCGIKDNILVEGEKCTCASKMLENYVASYDAGCIKKLKKNGAVILGKTNLDEFAFGSSCENSAFKVTKNPHDLSCVSGGSSGGSAAAIASDQACFALGTDTGCSVRTPASFCGVVGLKTTYGSVSRSGVIASASSLDQVGPLTKNVEDAETIFNIISGKDIFDATSVEFKYEKLTKEKPFVIGVPREFFGKGLNKDVEKIIKKTISKIEDQGFKIQEISLPSTDFALACYYIIQTSEASANLARFDGIRYGYSEIQNISSKDFTLRDIYLKSRGKGFGAESKRRIMLGTYSLSSGYYDAYYKKAQEVRLLIKQDFIDSFKKVDLIMGPVTPFPAFKIGEKANDPLSMYLADIYTVPINLAGVPAMSLPIGKIGKLPVGLQIIANHFEESKIFNIASIIEKIV